MSTIHVTTWQDAPVTTDVPWFADHTNLVTLVHFLADQTDNPRDIAYAVEKPWKYEAEFELARGLQEHSALSAHSINHVSGSADAFYCNDCEWTVGACDICGEVGPVVIDRDPYLSATPRVSCPDHDPDRRER